MSHQNIDKFFKVAMILFGQLFVDAFNLNYHVIRLYRNELLSLKGGNLFTDLVFETREGILLNIEFQDTKIKKKHLKKYMEYKVSLQCQSGKSVVTVVICTYHIKSEVLIFNETETSILKPIVHYLLDYYDEVKFISLKNKINNNLKFSSREIQYLILFPFMVHRNLRSQKVEDVCYLIEEIKKKQLFDDEKLYLPLILAIKQYILNLDEQNKLIGVLTMDMPADEIYEKVMKSGVYEQGLEQGLEQGFEEGENKNRCENVLALFEFGMSAKKISEALKLDLNIVNEILEE